MSLETGTDRIDARDRTSERNTILVVQHWLLHFYSVYTQVLHFFLVLSWGLYI